MIELAESLVGLSSADNPEEFTLVLESAVGPDEFLARWKQAPLNDVFERLAWTSEGFELSGPVFTGSGYLFGVDKHMTVATAVGAIVGLLESVQIDGILRLYHADSPHPRALSQPSAMLMCRMDLVGEAYVQLMGEIEPLPAVAADEVYARVHGLPRWWLPSAARTDVIEFVADWCRGETRPQAFLYAGGISLEVPGDRAEELWREAHRFHPYDTVDLTRESATGYRRASVNFEGGFAIFAVGAREMGEAERLDALNELTHVLRCMAPVSTYGRVRASETYWHMQGGDDLHYLAYPPWPGQRRTAYRDLRLMTERGVLHDAFVTQLVDHRSFPAVRALELSGSWTVEDVEPHHVILRSTTPELWVSAAQPDLETLRYARQSFAPLLVAPVSDEPAVDGGSG